MEEEEQQRKISKEGGGKRRREEIGSGEEENDRERLERTKKRARKLEELVQVYARGRRYGGKEKEETKEGEEREKREGIRIREINGEVIMEKGQWEEREEMEKIIKEWVEKRERETERQLVEKIWKGEDKGRRVKEIMQMSKERWADYEGKEMTLAVKEKPRWAEEREQEKKDFYNVRVERNGMIGFWEVRGMDKRPVTVPAVYRWNRWPGHRDEEEDEENEQDGTAEVMIYERKKGWRGERVIEYVRCGWTGGYGMGEQGRLRVNIRGIKYKEQEGEEGGDGDRTGTGNHLTEGVKAFMRSKAAVTAPEVKKGYEAKQEEERRKWWWEKREEERETRGEARGIDLVMIKRWEEREGRGRGGWKYTIVGQILVRGQRRFKERMRERKGEEERMEKERKAKEEREKAEAKSEPKREEEGSGKIGEIGKGQKKEEIGERIKGKEGGQERKGRAWKKEGGKRKWKGAGEERKDQEQTGGTGGKLQEKGKGGKKKKKEKKMRRDRKNWEKGKKKEDDGAERKEK